MLDLSCPDWWEKLQAGETPMPQVPVDEDEAEAAIDLFNSLRLPDVAGQPTFGEVGAPWCTDLVAALFGAVDEENRRRLINELFLLIPKKNSKTTNSAAFGVVWLTRNVVHNQSGLIIAPTQEVAETCFSQAANMIRIDPELDKIMHVQDHKKTITNRFTRCALRIKSFDMNVLTGAIPAFTILDELHLLASKSYAQKVLGQIRGGMITNPMALLIMITTQSTASPAGVFKAELEHARKVRDGKAPAKGLLAVTYEFPESVQIDPAQPWRDPAMWRHVLPNIGRSVREDLLLDLYEKDVARGDTSEQLWLSQHLNIQIGLGLHDGRWNGADYWERNAEPSLTLPELVERSEVIVAGFDGGGLDDLAGLCVTGRCATTQAWLNWHHAWAMPDVLEKRKEIAETLQDFIAAGDLTLCDADKPQQDFHEVAEILGMLAETGKLPAEAAMGLDPWGVSDLKAMLIEAGLTEEQVAGIPQGYKLSAAIWGMERKLKDGMYRHGGRPMMAWIVGNAKAEQRGNNVYVTKSAAGKAKIDPLIAGFNAYALMALNPQVAGRSYLNEADLMVL